MKFKTLLLCMALLSTTSVFAQSEKLTNQSVADMIELGFSESIIVTKIQTSETDFDISMEALKALKEKGVPENIIIAIMNVAQKSEDDSQEPKSGIYYQANQNEQKKILPTIFSGTQTNTLGAAFSYGIASSKIKALLNNAQSPNIIKMDNDITFIFYFVPQEDNTFKMGASNWWFRSATSPNEFVLVKLSIKKKRQRELVIGKVNVYAGSSSSIDAKATIPFTIESINEHTFKITPVEPLEQGEYCFVYQGLVPNGCSNQSVFDFSIRE